MSVQNKKRLKWFTVVSLPLMIAFAVWFVTSGSLTASAYQGPDKKGDAKKAPTKPGEDAGKSGKAGKKSGPPPALIRVATADTRDLQSRRDVIGRLREVRRTIVGTGQQGRVIVCDVEAGDTVGAKTILAQIDQTFVQISLASATAEHAKAVADHQRNESEVKRVLAQQGEMEAVHVRLQRDADYLKELIQSNSAKKKEYDDSKSLVDEAAARVEAAEAAVLTAKAAVLTAAAVKDSTKADIQRVEEEIKRFTVRAPFDGVVVRKIMEVGQWVTKGAPVIELVSRGTIDAVVDVPEHLINNIRVGSDVDVTIDALKQTIEGKVAAIIPLGESAARSFPVKVRLDDLDGQLKAGMSATASIPTSEKKSHITVPRDAILRSAADSVVWAVIDGKAMRISVDVLFADGDRFAVRTAARQKGRVLQTGMQVVIEGGERLLFPGQPVKIAPPPAVAPDAN